MPGAGGGENGELVFTGGRVSVWEDEKVWKWIVVMAAQQCEYIDCHEIAYFDMVNFTLPEFHLNKKDTFFLNNKTWLARFRP